MLKEPYCRGTEELDEIVQEAFVSAFEGLADFDTARPFYPWLKAIALNVLRQQARRRQTARHHRKSYLRHLQKRMVLDDGDPDCRIEALRSCLAQLGQAQVDLLKEKYTHERSITELARSHSTSDGAVKLRLLRLRNALRKCIEQRLAVEDY